MENYEINLHELINGSLESLPNFVNEEGIVYCCKNLINGKVYIGETKRTLRERWIEHKYIFEGSNTKNIKMAVYDAIRKYGSENFSVCILEKNLTDENKRKNQEKYWISKYNSFVDAENSNGYNMTTGGYAENKIASERIKRSMSTCIKRYGCLPMQTKESRKKAIETNRKNHNGNLAFQDKKYREKAIKTQIEKYGSLAMHLPENKEKAKKKMREKYGKVLPFNTKESIEKAQKIAPLYRIIGNINRHIRILKQQNLEINSKNYIFACGDTKRMWQQHIPNVLKRMDELKTLPEWTKEINDIFSSIEYDDTKNGIEKIIFK